jgi:hypothetical protein
MPAPMVETLHQYDIIARVRFGINKEIGCKEQIYVDPAWLMVQTIGINALGVRR